MDKSSSTPMTLPLLACDLSYVRPHLVLYRVTKGKQLLIDRKSYLHQEDPIVCIFNIKLIVY